MYEFKRAEEEIGYIPYESISALHVRVDKWAIKILDEIRGRNEKYGNRDSSRDDDRSVVSVGGELDKDSR